MNIKLKEINVYPIKSCRGFSVNKWSLSSNGLLYDREFALVNDKNKIMTLKRYPMLGKIISFINLQKDVLQVSFENNNLEIPLKNISQKIFDHDINIYKNNIRAYIYDDNITPTGI